MRNSLTNSTASPVGAGILTPNARKVSTLKKAIYFVDLIGFEKGNIEVDYTINNDGGHSAVISLSNLTKFLNKPEASNRSKRSLKRPGSSFQASHVFENIYEIVERYLVETMAGQTFTSSEISNMNVGELSKIINNSTDKSLIAECLKIRDSINASFFAKIDKRLYKAYGWVPKKSDW